MAIKEVSTWAGLVTALNRFETGDIIKLTADINLNTEYPQGVDSCAFDQSGYEGTTVTIDGDGHAIINLRTRLSSPVSIFTKTGTGSYLTVTFKNIDFVNLILTGASLVSMTSQDTMIFQNCRFVGSRSGASYLINNNTNVTLTICYIDMPWMGSGQTDLSYTSLIPKSTSNVSAVANYCWFREKYTGWTYSDGHVYSPDSTDINKQVPSFSFSMFKINGCYIDGSMTIPDGCDIVNSGTRYVYYAGLLSKVVNNSYTPSSQNVFDCDLTAVVASTSAPSPSDDIRTCGWSGVIKKNAHKPNGNVISTYSFPSGSSMGGSTTPIFATPAQMKDAQALYDLGFDIVVPSE